MTTAFQLVREAIESESLVGLATIVSGERTGDKLALFPDDRVEGEVGSAALAERIREQAKPLLAAHKTASFEVAVSFEVDADGTTTSDSAVEVFFEAFPPPAKLIVVGAVHVAIPLVEIANTLGFHTIVLDARAVYATEERFGHADELIIRWPAEALSEMRLHESTYCVFLTHDPKLDNPGLEVALRSDARYVGALGSMKTHAKRVEVLQEMGLSDEEISKIRAPIGIKLGGNRPEEIAVSIAAEIVAVRHGGA